MRLAIADVLTAAQLGTLRAILARGAFEDGRRTAGSAARSVKQNLQLAPGSPAYDEAAALAGAALAANETFQSAALPRTMSQPLFSRYEGGMAYGPHFDNALMQAPTVRSDLAFTLFITDPDDYAGGELVLMDAEGDSSVKLPAGALYLYPATTLHRVEMVTAGRREVCVGWIQSLVRDPRVREMIFDLARAKALASGDARDLVAKTLANLLRLHAEP
jgi:PKHD-type hydroxylase